MNEIKRGDRVRVKPLIVEAGKRYLQGKEGTVIAVYWFDFGSADVLIDGRPLPVFYTLSALERL